MNIFHLITSYVLSCFGCETFHRVDLCWTEALQFQPTAPSLYLDCLISCLWISETFTQTSIRPCFHEEMHPDACGLEVRKTDSEISIPPFETTVESQQRFEHICICSAHNASACYYVLCGVAHRAAVFRCTCHSLFVLLPPCVSISAALPPPLSLPPSSPLQIKHNGIHSSILFIVFEAGRVGLSKAPDQSV